MPSCSQSNTPTSQLAPVTFPGTPAPQMGSLASNGSTPPPAANHGLPPTHFYVPADNATTGRLCCVVCYSAAHNHNSNSPH